MHPMIIFYRDGQLQAAENALEALKHLCFLHNAFLESGDTGTAALLKRAVINIDMKKLEQVDILNACYEDARITNGSRYDIDSSKAVVLANQLVTISSKGRKPAV